jgi:hypothetical protein
LGCQFLEQSFLESKMAQIFLPYFATFRPMLLACIQIGNY